MLSAQHYRGRQGPYPCCQGQIWSRLSRAAVTGYRSAELRQKIASENFQKLAAKFRLPELLNLNGKRRG